MKKKYMVTISALSIITCGIVHQQELFGDGIVGGLFDVASDTVEGTGKVITGRATKDDKLQERREEDVLMIEDDSDMNHDEDMAEASTNGRGEISKEMEKGAASGEEVAGPVGGVVGGLFGVGVGAVKETGEVITGRDGKDNDNDVAQEKEEVEISTDTDDDMDVAMDDAMDDEGMSMIVHDEMIEDNVMDEVE